jgi:hypothetical protein
MPEEINPKFIADMATAVRSLSELCWRLQGRINALELICLHTIEDAARLHDDPKGYMRFYVERARVRAFPLVELTIQQHQIEPFVSAMAHWMTSSPRFWSALAT